MPKLRSADSQRHGWLREWSIRPVHGPGSACRDPASKGFDFTGAEWFGLERHTLFDVGNAYAAEEFALLGMARNNGSPAGFKHSKRRVSLIQAQARPRLTGAMALH